MLKMPSIMASTTLRLEAVVLAEGSCVAAVGGQAGSLIPIVRARAPRSSMSSSSISTAERPGTLRGLNISASGHVRVCWCTRSPLQCSVSLRCKPSSQSAGFAANNCQSRSIQCYMLAGDWPCCFSRRREATAM